MMRKVCVEYLKFDFALVMTIYIRTPFVSNWDFMI